MPLVIGVRFKRSSKIYYFEAGKHEYKENCGVVVETARGVEYGLLAMMPKEIPDEEIVQPLKPIVRLATDADDVQAARLEAKRPETMRIAEEKIAHSKLDMKLVDTEYAFDGSKLIIYFTADNRVDFRELVKDLAGAFHIRIELRQIGARDECKLLGGLGSCGRPCCCNSHMSDYAHVTIKMAKNQNLSLNPTKISGLCGRLMCCLSYENAYYSEVNKRMPKVGSEVELTDGRHGKVIDINHIKETVQLRIADEAKDAFTVEQIKLSDIVRKGKPTMVDESEIDESEELKSLEDK